MSEPETKITINFSSRHISLFIRAPCIIVDTDFIIIIKLSWQFALGGNYAEPTLSLVLTQMLYRPSSHNYSATKFCDPSTWEKHTFPAATFLALPLLIGNTEPCATIGLIEAMYGIYAAISERKYIFAQIMRHYLRVHTKVQSDEWIRLRSPLSTSRLVQMAPKNRQSVSSYY